MGSFEENYQIFWTEWNKNTTFQNVWDATKTVIGRTFKVLDTHTRNEEEKIGLKSIS